MEISLEGLDISWLLFNVEINNIEMSIFVESLQVTIKCLKNGGHMSIYFSLLKAGLKS